MKIILQGYESREWTDKQTGEVVEGTTIHYTHESMGVVGQAAVKKFFSKRTKLPPLFVGQEYILEYDENGRAVQFAAVNPALQPQERRGK